MADAQNAAPTAAAPSLDRLAAALNDTAARWFTKMLQGQPAGATGLAELLRDLATGFMQDQAHWRALQERLYAEHFALWRQSMSAAPAAATPLADRRFRAADWQSQPYFRYAAEAYLLTARWIGDAVDQSSLAPKAKARLRFYSQQWIAAAAPTNTLASNPEALRIAMETQGASLACGLEHLTADLQKGYLSITDEAAFAVGRNLAITPGAVVFENALLQLLQYAPTTGEVHARPLLMVPPFINKFYVLDLQPDDSFVRYAVAQGHTVFMISWKNAQQDLAQATWDDYVGEGVLRAVQIARDICGAERVNALGFCVGGTLLGCALAVEAARGERSIESVTFLTTMLDFADTGELDVFIDHAHVEDCERNFVGGGVFHGRELMQTFSSLRPNDLIWPYVINNYLKGGKPNAFDLLYWNSDSTNLPGPMYAWYLRNTYLENRLREPGRVQVCGAPVDFGALTQPTFILASREDHIVPWRTAYASTALLRGPLTFVLAASGHIAGVINPAHRNKRTFWTTAPGATLPANANSWLENAHIQPGSWWPRWSGWLASYGGEQVAARETLGDTAHPVIEPAPGRYVTESCN